MTHALTLPRTDRPLVRGAAVLLLLLTGCSAPESLHSEAALRRSVVESVRRELAQAETWPDVRTLERGPGLERLALKPELIPELERMAGPASYDRADLPLDDDLLGRPQSVLPLTLQQAIHLAVNNNLQIQFARLAPAIAEAQAIAAEAAFDWTLFNTFEFNNLDQPRTVTRLGFQAFGTGVEQRQTVTNATGLRRNLPTGGQLTLQHDLGYTDIATPGLSASPDPAREAALTLRLDQPLFRGFGSDVALAQVRLNRNAEREQIAALKRDLLRSVSETERAYWQLHQAQRDLQILHRLYERGVRTRDRVIAREFEATPAQIASARSRVERRWADVVRARNALRAASDALKAQINDPRAPLGAEVLLLAVDDAIDAPVSFSLADVLTTALQQRPEIQQAILSIDNTSIRQQLADNARLPRLDLRLQARLAGLNDHWSDAWDQVIDRDFVDYLIGVQFEQPLGNRAAEAQYRQRRLERMQAVIAYRNTVQQVVLEVKRALRAAATNYQLIQQTRVARYAEAENLRSTEVQMQLVRGFTLIDLDLQFRLQEALAAAEREEMAALVEYQVALAQLYAAMGTALERNRIIFRVPHPDEPAARGGLAGPDIGVVPLATSPPYLSPPRPRRDANN